MTVKKRLSVPKRRTRAEVQQLVAEFVSSGMRRSEFCRSRGLSLGRLHRHLEKQRWKRKSRAASSAGRLVPVELAARKSPAQHELSCGLAVVLPGLADLPIRRLPDLTPAAWVAQHSWTQDRKSTPSELQSLTKLVCRL